MRRVIVESPYAGDKERYVAYARRCMKDSLVRNESPLLSHLLYPQVLDELRPQERQWGIEAGLAWLPAADAMILYLDYGESSGMMSARRYAEMLRITVEERFIGKNGERPCA